MAELSYSCFLSYISALTVSDHFHPRRASSCQPLGIIVGRPRNQSGHCIQRKSAEF